MRDSSVGNSSTDAYTNCEAEFRARLHNEINTPTAVPPAPVGQKTLDKAAVSVAATGSAGARSEGIAYAEMFDPTTNFELSFNPAADYTNEEAMLYQNGGEYDGGAFDAFEATMTESEAYGEVVEGFNMSDFVNDDTLV